MKSRRISNIMSRVDKVGLHKIFLCAAFLRHFVNLFDLVDPDYTFDENIYDILEERPSPDEVAAEAEAFAGLTHTLSSLCSLLTAAEAHPSLAGLEMPMTSVPAVAPVPAEDAVRLVP